MNVRQYYERLFPDFGLILNQASGVSDAATIGDILAEMPLDSNCGDDCKAALDAAASVVKQIHMAFGYDKPDHFRNVLVAAVDVCGCFIRG